MTSIKIKDLQILLDSLPNHLYLSTDDHRNLIIRNPDDDQYMGMIELCKDDIHYFVRFRKNDD